MSLRIGIGTNLRIQGDFSWSSYWTTHLALKYSSRSGLDLLETRSGSNLNAKILPSYLYKPTGNEYAYVADNGGLDIGSSNLTVYGWVKVEDATASQYNILLGKSGLSGYLAGVYTIYSNITDGLLKFQISPSGGAGNVVTIASNIDGRTGWHFVLADVNVATNKARFFVDNVQQGADVSYTGTFPAMANTFGFHIGDYYNIITGLSVTCAKSSHSDTGVLHRLTTPTERVNMLLGIYPADEAAHWCCEGGNKDVYDTKGTYNLTGVNLGATKVKFAAEGSQYLLNNGWSLWQKAGATEERVPYGASTVALAAAGWGSSQVYSGSTTGLNMAPCLIGFNETSSAATELEIFDRSNTTRQTANSRASGYYDSASLATKSRYYIDEVSNYGIRKDYFNATYQNLNHCKLSGTLSNLSIVEITTLTAQPSASFLAWIKTYKRVSQSLTVGVGKDATFINAAIRKAFDGCTITIDDATYTTNLDLTWKELNLVGVSAVIIHYTIETQSLVSTLNLATNSTFRNITFDKRELFAGAAKPIVNVSACNPVFTNCQIGRTTYVDGYNSQNPMTIANASIVTMTGSAIKGTSCAGLTYPYYLLVKDTSKLIFEGTSFFACLRLQDTAEADIDTDILYTNGSTDNGVGILVEDDAVATVKVNTRELYFNTATAAEYAAGAYSANSFRLKDNANFQLSGNQITGGTRISGAGVVCLFKDITSTLGHFWLITEGSAGSSVLVTFDNCNLYIDWDDDVMGSHIVEEAKGAEVRIINGSVLEFSGHQGTWFSMGNTISCCGKLVIRNSEIIDNADDNVPYGDNYPGTILCYSKFDFEDTVITVKNWDGVGTNRCINFQKASGAINGRLKNVVLNSDNADEEEPIRFQGNEASLDGNDYLIVDNVTNNTGGFLLAVDVGNPVTTLATLEANVP